MRQSAQPLPAAIPGCQPGHHPQWVETHGAPQRARIGTPVPTTFHIECCRCGIATRPTASRALVESRWTDPFRMHLIPLSQLTQAREQAVSAFVPSARAA